MHIAKVRDYQEWISNVPLEASQTITVPIASESGTQTIGNVISMPFLRFGCFFHRNANLIFEVSMDNVNWVVVSTLAIPGATWMDAYQMGAPWHATGYWMIPWALLRIGIIDTSAINHSYTRFQAIAYTN